MKDYDKIKDIADAIVLLRRAFIAAGMSSPVSIELGNWNDEYALKHMMRPDIGFVEVDIGTDDPHSVGKVMGVKLLRPHNRPIHPRDRQFLRPRWGSLDE